MGIYIPTNMIFLWTWVLWLGIPKRKKLVSTTPVGEKWNSLYDSQVIVWTKGSKRRKTSYLVRDKYINLEPTIVWLTSKPNILGLFHFFHPKVWKFFQASFFPCFQEVKIFSLIEEMEKSLESLSGCTKYYRWSKNYFKENFPSTTLLGQVSKDISSNDGPASQMVISVSWTESRLFIHEVRSDDRRRTHGWKMIQWQ